MYFFYIAVIAYRTKKNVNSTVFKFKAVSSQWFKYTVLFCCFLKNITVIPIGT